MGDADTTAAWAEKDIAQIIERYGHARLTIELARVAWGVQSYIDTKNRALSIVRRWPEVFFDLYLKGELDGQIKDEDLVLRLMQTERFDAMCNARRWTYYGMPKEGVIVIRRIP